MNEPQIIPVEHAEKVNLVFFTDVHLAAKAPGRRRGTFCEEILGKLQWCSELTKMVKGTGICGGDFYHIKNPKSDSNPTWLTNRAMGILQGFPTGRIYGPAGNHDITGDNLETLPHQPLGTLMQSGAYHDLGYQPVIFTTASGLRVQVDAYDYEDGAKVLEKIKAVRGDKDAFADNMLNWDECPYHYRVAVVHAFNKRGKSELMFGSDFAIGHDDLSGTDYDVFLWGHDHARKGIIENGPQWHVQLGSLARAALAGDEVDREITAGVISFSREGVKIVEKPVPVKSLEMAFHTADIAVEKVDKRDDVAAFLQELESHAQAVDSEDPLEILATLTTETAIIETIKEVCELA
jgi:predicted phosphodiesterase